MSEEVATAVETPQEPSIAQAYEAEHGDPTGSKRKPERAESGRNTTLAEEEDTAREIGESGRRRHVVKTQPEPSLADALDGIATPEAEEFELPDGFSAYSAEDVEAVLELMGLTESDLQEPRFAALALKELESNFSPVEEDGESESEDDSAEGEAEEKPEEKPEEKKPEVKPEAKSKLADLTPEEKQVMETHINEVFQRSKQVTSPIYHEHFVGSLAKALDCPPEQMEALNNVTEILEFGAQSLMETAVPAMVTRQVTDFMIQNFAPMMEAVLPGIGKAFQEAQNFNTWEDVRSSSEAFADLPDLDTPEFGELHARVSKAAPWLAKWTPDPSIPRAEQLRQCAEIFARVAVGERFDPKRAAAQMAQAIETGRRSAEKSTRRVSASRILGRGGKTAGEMGKSDKGDRESLMDAWTRGGGGGAI